jgi:regulator of nucleoside diphosphate kinase
MQIQQRPAHAARPAIHISESDCDRIVNLATTLETRAPELAQMLLGEVDRATVYAEGELPGDAVALGSEVEFLDESSGKSRRVRLVLPAEADIERGRISILTPVGAGLIGLRAGDGIDWPCPDGRPRVLRIVAVDQAP